MGRRQIESYLINRDAIYAYITEHFPDKDVKLEMIQKTIENVISELKEESKYRYLKHRLLSPIYPNPKDDDETEPADRISKIFLSMKDQVENMQKGVEVSLDDSIKEFDEKWVTQKGKMELVPGDLVLTQVLKKLTGQGIAKDNCFKLVKHLPPNSEEIAELRDCLKIITT